MTEFKFALEITHAREGAHTHPRSHKNADEHILSKVSSTFSLKLQLSVSDKDNLIKHNAIFFNGQFIY